MNPNKYNPPDKDEIIELTIRPPEEEVEELTKRLEEVARKAMDDVMSYILWDGDKNDDE